MAEPLFNPNASFNDPATPTFEPPNLPQVGDSGIPSFSETQVAEQTKNEALRESSRRNLEALERISKNYTDRLEKDRNTWSNRARRAGFAAGIPEAIDLTAQAYSGLSTMAGQVEAGYEAYMATGLLLNAPDGAVEARNRQLKNQATPEDLALLNSAMPSGRSVLSLLQRAEARIQAGDTARRAWDRTDVAEQRGKAELADSLGDGYDVAMPKFTGGLEAFQKGDRINGALDMAKGLGGLIKSVGTSAWDNPGGLTAYIAENVPQVAVALTGPVGVGGTALVYGLDLVGQGMFEHRQKNGGALPTENQLIDKALMAALAAGADMVGDVATVGRRALGLGLSKAADDIVEGAATVVPKNATKGFKEALLSAGKQVAAPIAQISSRTAQGFAGEAPTEGFQTWAENSIKGEETTGKDIFIGGAIGGLVGGSMAGSLASADSAAKGVSKVMEKGAEVLVAREERQATQKSAVDTGDVSALVDPKSAFYDPSGAVDALSKNADQDEAKFDENFSQAKKLVAQLEKRADGMRQMREASTPEGLKAARDQLASLEAQLAAVDPADTAKVQDLNEQIEDQRADVEEATEIQGTTDALDKDVAEFEIQLEQAQERLNQFTQKSAKRANPVADIEAAKGSDTVTATAAVDRVINLSMASANPDDVLTAESAEELANNTVLPPAQRKWLGEYAKTQRAVSAKDVSQDVLSGSGGNVGVAQYRQRMANAIAADDRKQAERQLAALAKFHALQESKASAAAAAFKQGKGTTIVRESNGQWKVGTGQGQVKIDSARYPEMVAKDAAVLRQARAELSAAFDMKFRPELNQTKATKVTEDNGEASTGTLVIKLAEPVAAKADVGVGADTKAQTSEAEPVTEDAATAATTKADEQSVVSEEPGGGEPALDEVTSSFSTSSSNSSDSSSVSSASSESTQETEGNFKNQTQSNQDSAAPTDVAQEQDGQLSVMSNKSPAGTAFRQKNLIADYFQQTAGKVADGTLRPLVAVKNFLSKWGTGFSFSPFLKAKAFTPQQQAALKAFRAYARKWSPVIQANALVNKDSQYYYKNLAQFFVVKDDEKLDLEENLKTAISYAAFSWAADSATKSTFNTKEEINAILNRDENHLVSWEETQAFADIGVRQNVMVNQLGQAIVQALGFKANANAPLELQAKLASSLGAYALKVLIDEKIAIQTVYTGTGMNEKTGGTTYADNDKHRFIKVNKELATPIADAVKGSQSILDKMFKAEAGPKEPSLEPVAFEQAATKNTNQRVPKKLAEIIDAQNKQPNFLRQDMWHLMDDGGLSHENWFVIAGAEDIESKHKVMRLGAQASNDGLERELINIRDWVSNVLGKEGYERPFYFQHSVWKQQRVGIATNVVNPQTSKIHRRMVFKKGYETTVALSNAADMENFFLRVGEGLGIKTDKQANEKSLAAVQTKLADPIIQAAVASLRKRLHASDRLTDADQQAIVAGAKAGGEAMHSMDALVALAHYEQAIEDKKRSFVTHLTGEVDGVTNGPMLSHLFYGAGSTVSELLKRLNQGGFFQQGSEYVNYNRWRGESGEFDLYETLAKNITQALEGQVLKTPTIQPILSSIYAFTGALTENGAVVKAGRNIVKTPLTAMVFGSSINRAVDSMADGFIESIYGQIEKLGSDNKKRTELIENLNILLINGVPPKAPFMAGKLTLPKSMPIEELMNHEFNKDQIQALKRSFTTTLGKAVKTTMQEDFASFLNKTKQHNTAAQLAFDLYNAVYQSERDHVTKELTQTGEIALSNHKTKPVPITEMAASKERGLRKRLAFMAPLLHTPMSKASGSLASALYMSKADRTLSQKNTFNSEVLFAKSMPNGDERTNVSGYEVVEKNPGVAMTSMPIHSADSAISHLAANLRDVLNIHDAHLSGLGSFTETAQALNEQTFKVLLSYSPMSEMADSLDRVVLGLAEVMKTASPELRDNVRSVLDKYADRIEVDPAEVDPAEVDPANVLHIIVGEYRQEAFRSDSLKLEVLSQLQAIDQYALEGGQYVVTDKDRNSALERIKHLERYPSGEVSRAMRSINQSLDSQINGQLSSNMDMTVEPEDEAEVNIQDTQVLDFAPVRGMQLLEWIINDESVDAALRDQASKAMDAMRNGATTRSAVVDTVDRDQVAAMVQLLAERYRAIPNHLWGGVGSPTIGSDPRLVAFFEKTPNVKADRVIEVLKRLVSAMPDSQSTHRDFQMRLLSILGRTVNPELKVRYVTPATHPSLVLEAPGKNSRGWYVATPDGQEEVYVLSPDFIHSGLQAETLIHELVHGALARLVASELAKKKADASYKSDALELIQELQELMDQASKVAKGTAAGSQQRIPTVEQHNRDILAFEQAVEDAFSKELEEFLALDNNEDISPTQRKRHAELDGFFYKLGVVTQYASGEMVLSKDLKSITDLLPKALVDQAQSLRKTSSALINSSVSKSQDFAAAFANLDDFIAWGMTNVGFQNQIINQVSMKSGTQGNRLINGMRRFIEIVTGILFRKSSKGQQERDENGMAILVSNVSGLFAAAAEVKSPVQVLLQPNVNLSQASNPSATVQTYGTIDILNALDQGKHSGEFSAHLRTLMGSIVDKLHGPYGSFKAALMKDQAISPMDVWLKALATGKAPFASEVLANVALSEQEAFAVEQVEATVRAALESNDSTVRIAYKQLEDLFGEAKRKLKPESFYTGDWAKATQAEKDEAKAKYDFVFQVKSNSASDRSDYLSRFAALGLASESFRDLLLFSTDRKTRDVSSGQNFAQKVQIVFENLLEFFNGKIAGTLAGQRADARLTALVGQLVDIEAKKQHKLKRRATQLNPIAQVEAVVKVGVEAARSKVADIAGSNAVRNSKNPYVRAAGALARTSVNDQVELFVAGMKQVRDREFPGERYGLLAGTLNDVRGPLAKFMTLLRATKYYEGQRKKFITQSSTMALNAFENGGKDLTKQEKAGITALFLRTGASSLLQDGGQEGVKAFGTKELESLLADPKAMAKAIADQEAKLYGMKMPTQLKDYMRNQANALGYFRATDEARSTFVLMNAHNIAQLFETGYEDRITEEQKAEAEAILEPLVALYSMEYAPGAHKAEALKVLARENARTDQSNGVEFVIKLHRRMSQDSQDRLFNGKRVLMQHGYTPEIYNPHVEVQVANDVDGQDLVDRGFARGRQVGIDPVDPDKSPRRLYVLRDGGLNRYQSGIVSFTSKAMKGSPEHNGFTATHMPEGLANHLHTLQLSNDKSKAMAGLFRSGPRLDLANVKQSFMVPVLNEMGKAVNYRYMMNAQTKNEVLERTNDFDQVLGVLEGSIYDKVKSVEQNRVIIQALHDDHEQNYSSRKASFVEVGPNSRDPSMREIWKMLPDETRADVRRIWGGSSMSVRVDSLDIIFGYRKLSLANVFKRDLQSNEHVAKLFRGMVEMILKMNALRQGLSADEAENSVKRAAVLVARGERIWQELVREVKDIIVVKTGTVLMGNIWSNVSLLIADGVPLKDIVTHHLVAMRGVTAYQENSALLAEIEQKISLGYLGGADEQELQSQAARLRDKLARNPVAELIQAGLMPTIVEDLAGDEDPYSYKSNLVRLVEEKTAKLPNGVARVGKFVYMAHDTKMYQGLSRITQLSDFVARYTMYQHLTNRKDNPLNQEAAIEQASDAFINYDVPMHRTLQWTDDMGFTPFTKYFLRIQRVLLKVARDNPARVMAMLALNNLMDLGPLVFDSSAWHRVPSNPLDIGALKLPTVLDDLATVNGAISLIK